MNSKEKSQTDPKSLALSIRNKALEFGFDKCGFIKLEAVADYTERLEERIRAFPEVKPMSDFLGLGKFAYPQEKYDWARSIIVCAVNFGKYKIPAGVDNYIGKLYLYENRVPQFTQGYSPVTGFEAYLAELGIKTAKELFGITAYRWAALKANLGVIRKNNFLYTEAGSWVWLEAWLTDIELEYHERTSVPPCPDNCRKCIDACPTGALSGPYEMNMNKCIARLTFNPRGLASEELQSRAGEWLYGCDACQNACPMNENKWQETIEYPQLNDLADALAPEKIVAMDEELCLKTFLPKFYYINKDIIWMWKCNALRAMANAFKPEYKEYLLNARNDKNEHVRNIANWACVKTGILS